jgi:7-cyano-7-deazaguanine synthase
LAYKWGVEDVVTGVCQTDSSGYPDTRDSTIKSLQATLSLGMEWPLVIHTPLMWLTKAESVNLAMALPGCMEALKWSHTCYEGEYPPCENCPACLLRIKGFAEAGVKDPIYLR